MGIREFASGATRNGDGGKLSYTRFLSPLVVKAFAEYMEENRYLEDGSIREPDNWKKGMGGDTYLESGMRHMIDWWTEHDYPETSREGLRKALCGVLFNAMGRLHELIMEEEGYAKIEHVRKWGGYYSTHLKRWVLPGEGECEYRDCSSSGGV